MKKLLFTLLLTFVSVISFSQTYHTATKTEMYVFNRNLEKWELYDVNLNVDIVVVLEENFVTIQANSPTMYRILQGSAKNISQKDFKGYRYEAIDLKKDIKCYIDIIETDNDSNYIISIFKLNDYILRYYMKSE